jgi:hypothetical protein
MEAELQPIFESLCDANKLLSKESVKVWDEVASLLQDGMLDDEEFEELWDKTEKAHGSSDQLDMDGFLSFNVFLDGLFEFDNSEMRGESDVEREISNDAATRPSGTARRSMVEGDDLPPSVLFSSIMGPDGFVSQDDLQYWVELSELVADGDLQKTELDTLFKKAGNGKDKLDQAAFTNLVNTINDLFEDVDDAPSTSETISLKVELIDTLNDLNDPDLLPCGLDSDEREQKEIISIINDLEKQPTNIVRTRDEIDQQDLIGTWELLYSSSSAFKFNKGLSGIGGSFPNGKFGGLKQTFKFNKFASDVEYVERINVTPDTASFDVTVTGDWQLRRSISLFTGEPSIVLTIEPDMVKYGPTSTRGDHWKSLGPMNMLDISYLDNDLRIMRGNTSVDTVFIFRRVA